MEPLNTAVYNMHWKENNDLLRKCLIDTKVKRQGGERRKLVSDAAASESKTFSPAVSMNNILQTAVDAHNVSHRLENSVNSVKIIYTSFFYNHKVQTK